MRRVGWVPPQVRNTRRGALFSASNLFRALKWASARGRRCSTMAKGWDQPGGAAIRWRPGEGEEKFMLSVFYGAFSPTCFALLGLWLVVVQIRLREWQGSAIHRRRSYGVALHFALPGAMSLLALIDPQDAIFWRVSFAIVALG